MQAQEEDPLERVPRWDQFFAFITGFPFPLGPSFTRKTCRYEVGTSRTLSTPCGMKGL